MKKGILSLLFVFTVLALHAQRNVDITNFRAGVNGGLVVGDFSDSYSFLLGVDMYHHWGVSKVFDIGVTTGFFNAFGEEPETVNDPIFVDGFDNLQFVPVGVSFRIYPGKNVGFKFGTDIGYAIGINEGNNGALYYRPSLGIDVRGGTSEFHLSYFAVNDETVFSSVLLGYLFLF